VIGAWVGGLGHILSWSSVARYQADLLAAVAAYPVLAPAAYALIYAVIVAFSIPEAAVVTVLGGLLFGPLLGGTLAVLAATAGSVALFLVARTAFAATLARRAETLLERIRPGLHRDGFSYLLALRLIPAVPFWLVNLGAAFCGMRLLPYAAATLIGIIPVTFLFAWIGSGVSEVLAAGQAPNLSVVFSARVLGPLLALATVALLPVVWRRWKRDGA
jgi:uncharacterized membrane protein YdjX (TVP38/TMEM64 family)